MSLKVFDFKNILCVLHFLASDIPCLVFLFGEHMETRGPTNSSQLHTARTSSTERMNSWQACSLRVLCSSVQERVAKLTHIFSLSDILSSSVSIRNSSTIVQGNFRTVSVMWDVRPPLGPSLFPSHSSLPGLARNITHNSKPLVAESALSAAAEPVLKLNLVARLETELSSSSWNWTEYPVLKLDWVPRLETELSSPSSNWTE
jgi:hypothetical protein